MGGKPSRYGMLECEHDTPTPLHDALWTEYDKYVPSQLTVIAGPFHKEITIQYQKPRVVSWVIIDLHADPDTHKDAIDKAKELKNALIEVGGRPQFPQPSTVEARFYELADSTRP